MFVLNDINEVIVEILCFYLMQTVQKPIAVCLHITFDVKIKKYRRCIEAGVTLSSSLSSPSRSSSLFFFLNVTYSSERIRIHSVYGVAVFFNYAEQLKRSRRGGGRINERRAFDPTAV